jgi:hypothetical protein
MKQSSPLYPTSTNYRWVTGVAALPVGIRSYEALISLVPATKVWVWWGSGIVMGAFRGAMNFSESR